MTRWRGIIAEYRKFLPVNDQTPVITLDEGNTPLIQATRLAKKIAPGIDLYLKFEGANPTGSFKDRGMTLAISKAVENGARAVICASTGNTSASAAAYGARAGLAAASQCRRRITATQAITPRRPPLRWASTPRRSITAAAIAATITITIAAGKRRIEDGPPGGP